jgi:predicted XRE-type DNA-binding protein
MRAWDDRDLMIKRLKECLRKTGLRQSDMAKEMGVSRQVISRWFVTGAISESKLTDIVDWFEKHGVNTTAVKIRYGAEARPNESYLGMVMRTVNEIVQETGIDMPDEERADLIEEIYTHRYSPVLIKSMITRFAKFKKKGGGRAKA